MNAPAAPLVPVTTATPCPEPLDLMVWLAGVFVTQPTAETVAAARSDAAAPLLAALLADPDLGPGTQRLVTALAEPVDDVALAARLGKAFAMLFLGIGGPGTVSPYESVWRTGRLFQEPAGDMNRLLATHNLTMVAAGEAADHLSVELMLLAHLAGTNHPDETALLRRLAGWVPDFAEAAIARDDTGYFAGAAQMLARLVAREQARADQQAFA